MSDLSILMHDGEGVEVEWEASCQVVTDSKPISLPPAAKPSLGEVVKLRHMGGGGEMVSHQQPPGRAEKGLLRAQLGSRT